MTKELPQWILSAYGPGRAAIVPRQLFGGLPRELSFEELRLRQYELVAGGKQQQAFQVEQELVREADEQNKQALRQIDNAISYIIEGANEHPNRIDVANASTAGDGQDQSGGSQSSKSFGASNPFQSAQNKNASPFGQPAASLANDPSDISTNTPAAPIFGQNPFSTGTSPSSFGQTSQAQPSNSFARPLQPNPALNPLGRQTQTQSVFGQLAQPRATTNAFNQKAQAASASNPFQTSQAAPSAFSMASQEPTGVNPFAKSALSNSTSTSEAISNGAVNSALPLSLDVVPTGQTLRIWKGKPVVYEEKEPYFKSPEGKLVKIWFPHGPPELANEEGVGREDDLALKERYRKAEETGTFGECEVPEVAPMMEWVSWDL